MVFSLIRVPLSLGRSMAQLLSRIFFSIFYCFFVSRLWTFGVRSLENVGLWFFFLRWSCCVRKYETSFFVNSVFAFIPLFPKLVDESTDLSLYFYFRFCYWCEVVFCLRTGFNPCSWSFLFFWCDLFHHSVEEVDGFLCDSDVIKEPGSKKRYCCFNL